MNNAGKRLSSRLSPIFGILMLVGFACAMPARAASDVHARIRQIQQERVHLKAIREKLESKLGQLGRSLKKLDRALVRANSDAMRAVANVRQADARLAGLTARRLILKRRVDVLKRNMMSEVAAAYRYAERPPLWLGIMFGAQVTDIPHHQYILSRLMDAQAEHRREFVQDMVDLTQVARRVRHQRVALDQLRQEKLVRQQKLTESRKAKRMLRRRVRKDASLKKQRDQELARQEAALKRLLQGISSTLLASDEGLKRVPMRNQKGRLPWPLKGRIVVHFRSRPVPGGPRLAGIQLAPRHGHGQVRAIAAGQVRYADWFGGYGLMLIVDHGDGLVTVYAHNDALYKSLGDWVEPGDVLADAGSTGWVRGVRLYFEVRDGGRPVNPARWCRK